MKISLSLAALLSALTAAQAARVPATSEGTGTGTRWTFTSGPATLKSGAKAAGRIMSLQYAGLEILHMDTATATNYGSTFWPSPQAAWASNWPPSANIDGNGAYTAMYTDTSLVLNGQTDATNNVRINKQYWANSADTSFGQRFTLINTGTSAKAWAPWQDTRVDTGGIYLFPKGTGAPTGDLGQFVKDSNNISWYRHDANNTLASGTTKFYADGSLGWFAHVKANRVVLIKKFSDTPAAKKAPGVENEIELYSTNRPLTGTDFVEMEVQGSYDTIPAGDSIVWNMKWYVRKLPDSVTVAVGNPSIVNFVNKVLAGPVSINGNAARSARASSFQLGSAGRRISLDLAKNADVTLSLLNSSGREISRLHAGRLAQGRHEFALGAAMPKGVYWIVLKEASRPGILGMHKLVWLEN
jgi:hypothetical protein